MPGSSGLAAQLGAAVTQGLALGVNLVLPVSSNQGSSPHQTAAPTADGCAAVTGADRVRCLGALLSCLEHARRVRTAAMRALPTTSNGRASPPAASWARVYCIHVDYLAAAAAALTCCNPFTALLYIEAWCEERHGRLVFTTPMSSTAGSGSDSGSIDSSAGPPALAALSARLRGGSSSSSSRSRAEAAQLEALLLRLYSDVNEPDALYALAATFGSACPLYTSDAADE